MRPILSIVWPAQAVITESLFRHFSMMAEVAGYLREHSQVVKHLNFDIKIEDCAVVSHTAMNISQIVHRSEVIAIAINMNNVREAVNMASFIKSVNNNKTIIAYGEAIACGSDFFSNQLMFDYVVDSGQFEIGIDVALCLSHNLDYSLFLPFCNSSEICISGRLIKIRKDIILPEMLWGMPQLDLLPISDYLRIGNQELHITACKGCPFNCEFCNEVYVSTNNLRYRSVEQIVNYLTVIAPKYNAKSVYLDASTFTYNQDWVRSLCDALLSTKQHITPWKTCTRLDCLDESLIMLMGAAGCGRISIGIESISQEIQKRNNKVIDLEKLKSFAEICNRSGISLRALLIIGLDGQSSKEISIAHDMLKSIGIQTRFRVLQDFRFMQNKIDLSLNDFDVLNRWLINSPFDDMDINSIRTLEYPPERTETNFP